MKRDEQMTAATTGLYLRSLGIISSAAVIRFSMAPNCAKKHTGTIVTIHNYYNTSMCFEGNVLVCGLTVDFNHTTAICDTRRSQGIKWPGRVELIQQRPPINTSPDQAQALSFIMTL